MVFKGYLTGIIIICFVFLINRAIKHHYLKLSVIPKIKIKKIRNNIFKNTLFVYIIPSILLLILFGVNAYSSHKNIYEAENIIAEIEKLAMNSETVNQEYIDQIIEILYQHNEQDDSGENSNVGLNELQVQIEALEENIDNINDNIEKLKDTTEDENERQNMELFVNGIGVIVIPVLVCFINIYSNEIKDIFKKRIDKDDEESEL